MSDTTRIRHRMNELLDAQERRTTITLALLVISIMLLPVGAIGAQEIAPVESGAAPAVDAAVIQIPADGAEAPASDPVEVPPIEIPGEEAPTEDADPSEGPAADDPAAGDPSTEEAPAEDEGLRGYALPGAEGDDASGEDAAAPEAAPDASGDEAQGPEEVQAAEGGDTEEVAAPGEAPAQDAALIDAPAEGEAPVAPPIEIYGPQVVPSLGTASAPWTQDYSAMSQAPLVLAPMVADQQVKPAGLNLSDQTVLEKTPLLSAPQSVQRVAAATLSVVEPSWYATAAAMAVLFGAAAYAAVLRRRGDEVPEALAFTGAVRPGDLRRAVRSVRPADMAVASVRSVRPR